MGVGISHRHDRHHRATRGRSENQALRIEQAGLCQLSAALWRLLASSSTHHGRSDVAAHFVTHRGEHRRVHVFRALERSEQWR